MSSPLLPPERMALTVARAQIKRGEDPTPNVAAVLIMALARLIDKIGDEETQLQAIAGASKCWHGNVYPHVDLVINDRGKTAGQGYCEGSPEFAALLDTLIEENNDEN